jgi:hypothetical protein
MPQTRSYVGGSYAENFDGMGLGTSVPANWYLGIGGAADGTGVVVSDGSVAPLAGTLGYNFGSTSSAGDRALGTIAMSGARNMEVRIQNDTGRDISSFSVAYDGEQWRVGTLTSPSGLTLRYSADGTNYVDMGSAFNFTAPRVAVPLLLENAALDGNSAANRVAGIGGTYAPTKAVPDGGTIYLRWVDADDAGADPGLAVDNFTFMVAAVGGPPLAIRDNHNNTVTVSWDLTTSVYVLESKPDLSNPGWAPVTDGVDVPTNGRHNVTVSTSASPMRYFRLQQAVGTP